jgi:LacI family transcriptional regulator
MRDKLTIQDIARLAGVSKATVSRVLNHNPSVAPELSERVQRIMREHDFIPNVTATELAGGKTRLVGVLTPPLTWPAVPEMLRGVAEYIEQTSYEMVLYSFSLASSHSDVLDRILPMRLISGLLAILPGELASHLASRYHQGLPLVMIDDQEKPEAVPWVGIDNTASAYEATRYLLDLGHRRIAYLQGPSHYACVRERYRGYLRALQEAGVMPDPALVLQGRFDVESGRECALALFSRERSTWPDALFASNDQMAYGVLEIAERQGICVPEDLSLIGFDDNLLSAHVRPPLTTVHQPFSQMGYTAMQVLLSMIDPTHLGRPGRQKGGNPPVVSNAQERVSADHPPRLQLPTRLVVRASSRVHSGTLKEHA